MHRLSKSISIAQFFPSTSSTSSSRKHPLAGSRITAEKPNVVLSTDLFIESLKIQYECTICRTEVERFPSSPPTKLCAHPAQICHTCLQEVIRVAVDNGRAGNGIACPNDECDKKMEYADVETWAAEPDFQAYDMLLLKLQLGNDEDFIRCLNVGCTAGQFHSGADDTPLIRCYSCGAKQCYQHRAVWHEGYTCTQWDEELRRRNSKNDEVSQNLISTVTKACPGPKCGRRIEKIDGCDHMLCKPPGGCGFEFCWLCLAPYDPIRRYDNSRHYDNCKYYSGRRGGHPAPSHLQPSSRNVAGPSSPTVNRGNIRASLGVGTDALFREMMLYPLASDSDEGEEMEEEAEEEEEEAEEEEEVEEVEEEEEEEAEEEEVEEEEEQDDDDEIEGQEELDDDDEDMDL